MAESRSDLIAFIFARGGSKGVPRKNVRHAGGKPLIGIAVECALASRSIGRIIVSTDDAEIAEVARAHGAETPFMRPAELAADTAAEVLAWRHAVTAIRDKEGADAPIDPFISVPTTSPLRAPEDIDAALDEYWRLEAAGAQPDMILSVTPAHRSPYFNMVVEGPEGWVRVASQRDGVAPTRRQDAPAVFDITTCVYVARVGHVMAADQLMQGNIGCIMVPQERALDVDTEHDLLVADLLLSQRGSR